VDPHRRFGQRGNADCWMVIMRRRFSGGDAGAGLADANTLFISSLAAAGGDGSMGRPWNSLAELGNTRGRLKTRR